MPELIIGITLTVDTALSMGAGGSGSVLADKAIVRNRLNQLVLPGSHLKGRLRHACEVIARTSGLSVCDSPRAETMCPQSNHVKESPCVICRLFGSPTWPSPLQFGDLVYGEPAEIGGASFRPDNQRPSLRPGASINRRRRTVEEQRLFFIETSPPAALARFHADHAIVGWLPDDEKAIAGVKLLLAGLELIQSWGGGKSRGLGWGRVQYQALLDDDVISLTDLGQAIAHLKREESRV